MKTKNKTKEWEFWSVEGSPNTGIEKLDDFIPVSEEHQTKTKKLATQSMVKA